MRDFKGGPTPAEYETPGGPVCVRAINDNLIFVTAGHSTPSIVVRGVRYSASAHFRREEDRWVPDDRERDAVSAHRVDTFVDASRAAQRSIEEMFAGAVDRFVDEHEEDLVQAAAAYVSNDIMRLEKDITKLEDQLAELMRQRTRLLAEEENIQARLGTPAPRF